MRAENETFVRELMAKHVGASFERDQRHVLEARLTSLARGRSLESADALVGTLRVAPNGPLLDSVIEALTTHETTFFRDGTPFKALSFHVLPELLRARGAQRRLRVWSAACSTGQEPYSLAMLLRERFPELERWDVRLLGTDVCRATLERAREGRYGDLELKRGLTQGARDKFFVKDGDEYRIREPIRRMVTWETINLTAEWPSMSVCDLILMRNVLIYFSPEARRRVFSNVARHLAPDGYLLLGTSETTFGSSDELTPCVIDGATFYRRVAK